MQKLNLPSYPFKISGQGRSSEIFDGIRKKYVALTPEEWVRQHMLMYLSLTLSYPASLIAVEYSLVYNTMKRRCDAVVFDITGRPLMIIECKAPEVKIDGKVFSQIARYNHEMKVPYLIVTNGISNFCFGMNREKGEFEPLNRIPLYEELCLNN